MFSDKFNLGSFEDLLEALEVLFFSLMSIKKHIGKIYGISLIRFRGIVDISVKSSLAVILNVSQSYS